MGYLLMFRHTLKWWNKLQNISMIRGNSYERVEDLVALVYRVAHGAIPKLQKEVWGALSSTKPHDPKYKTWLGSSEWHGIPPLFPENLMNFLNYFSTLNCLESNGFLSQSHKFEYPILVYKNLLKLTLKPICFYQELIKTSIIEIVKETFINWWRTQILQL